MPRDYYSESRREQHRYQDRYDPEYDARNYSRERERERYEYERRATGTAPREWKEKGQTRDTRDDREYRTRTYKDYEYDTRESREYAYEPVSSRKCELPPEEVHYVKSQTKHKRKSKHKRKHSKPDLEYNSDIALKPKQKALVDYAEDSDSQFSDSRHGTPNVPSRVTPERERHKAGNTSPSSALLEYKAKQMTESEDYGGYSYAKSPTGKSSKHVRNNASNASNSKMYKDEPKHSKEDLKKKVPTATLR